METIKKECKVVMLPCKNSNKGIYKSACSEKLHYFDKRLENSSQSYHLYILSDDEIKEGDYFIDHATGDIDERNSEELQFYQFNHCRKIISSTDLSLNLPKPSQAFIKKYCKLNGKIDKVMVEYSKINDRYLGNSCICGYDFTIGDDDICDCGSYKRVKKYSKKEEIKTNSKNEISISSIKNNWSREEVEDLLNEAMNYSFRNREKHYFDFELLKENWIKENL